MGIVLILGYGSANFQSENFTPDSNRFDSERFGILPDPAAHGRSGPINVAYPRYFYNQSGEQGHNLVSSLSTKGF